MKPWHGVVLLGTVLLGSTTVMAQSTEMDIFRKRVEKFATPTFEVFNKPKGLCVCISDPSTDLNGAAGVLDSTVVNVADAVPQRIRVRCMVMKATSDGNITQAESCEDFVPLAK